MADLVPAQRGLYFEDYNVSDIVRTKGRTITEADIVNFAGVSGDYNQIHVNEAYAQTAGFGSRIAHGILIHAIASGLAAQTGIMEGTVMAFRRIECKFTKPVRIGDTIHVEMEIIDLKRLRRLGGGQVTSKVSVMNQDNEVVQRANWELLVKSRPEAAE